MKFAYIYIYIYIHTHIYEISNNIIVGKPKIRCCLSPNLQKTNIKNFYVENQETAKQGFKLLQRS